MQSVGLGAEACARDKAALFFRKFHTTIRILLLRLRGDQSEDFFMFN